MYGQPRLSKQESINGRMQQLQKVQNDMHRLIHGYKRSDHINLERLRKQNKMFSVNQLTVYHVALETHNVLINNSSEQLRERMLLKTNQHYTLRSEERRDLQVPIKPRQNCTRFSYTGAKVWNSLPTEMRKDGIKAAKFKKLLKGWIWDTIP